MGKKYFKILLLTVFLPLSLVIAQAPPSCPGGCLGGGAGSGGGGSGTNTNPTYGGYSYNDPSKLPPATLINGKLNGPVVFGGLIITYTDGKVTAAHIREITDSNILHL